MRDLIKRHLQSDGFKSRLKNWYLPALKVGVSFIYNKIIAYFESNHFGKVYSNNKAYKEEVPSSTPILPTAPADDVVLPYDSAVEIIRKYQIGHIPQILGTCVSHTIVNAIRFVTKVNLGKDIQLSEQDIYMDRDTLRWGLDNGMFPDKAIDRVAKKGVAIRGIVPTANTTNDLLKTTRKEYPDNQLQTYRIKPIVGRENIYHATFDNLWAYITNEYKNGSIRPLQITIHSFSGWWRGGDLPTATGKINGSHSLNAVTIPFMYNGERAFFVIDSSFYKGKVWRVGRGIRIVRESTWRGLGISARKYIFNATIEANLANAEVLPVVPQPNITLKPAKFSDKNENVTNIQKYLIKKGYKIPALTSGISKYGFYGVQTATAVKAWQVDNWKAFNRLNSYWTINTLSALEGKSFGALSVVVAQEV